MNTDASYREGINERLKVFIDSPFTWGAIGMLVGAVVAVVPLNYFFALAWFFIWVAMVRAKFFEGASPWQVIGGNTGLAIVLAFVVYFGYKHCPKPPTLDETATAIARRMPPQKVEISQNQPPPQLQVTKSPVYLKSASAADIAEAVLEKLPQPSVPVVPALVPPPPSNLPQQPDSQALQREAFGLVRQINDWVTLVSQAVPDMPSITFPGNSSPSDIEKATQYSENLDRQWQNTFQSQAVSMISRLHIPGRFNISCRATQLGLDTDFSARLRRYKDCATLLDDGAKKLKE
jgi:hypothetical protein